ncbi:uncharacterized protein LOC133893369 [Phragmites australis]|uniref:uncharacterized protein LOC133893369 n=1 Tax=Phragmites australis TaxID=29695 RepID=UPI002D76ECDC|nr:uncharacterized protein LOC133893369 [Phragmites australis]
MSGKNKRGGRNGVDAVARPAARCMPATIVSLVVLLLVASALLFMLSPPATPGGGKGPREPVELAIGIAGHEGWLDVLRAWAKLACFKLRPAEPRYDVVNPASVKNAAKKSLEMGKETVEHSAESAARATEEALERTTETVKRKVSRSPSARRRDGDL